MRVLVACEYSGRVRQAFRNRGHDAVSCDLLPSEDDSPHHLRRDVKAVLASEAPFDLMIAHPPCTYLAVSGLHWNSRAVLVDGRPRAELTEEALDFVRFLMDADVPKICVENPVSCISSRIRKPDQIIQPWWFGEDASKKTCLWLKGLPKLLETNRLPGDDKTRRANQTASGQNKLPPSDGRWKERSRTYSGVAAAMASQWGCGGTLDAPLAPTDSLTYTYVNENPLPHFEFTRIQADSETRLE